MKFKYIYPGIHKLGIETGTSSDSLVYFQKHDFDARDLHLELYKEYIPGQEI